MKKLLAYVQVLALPFLLACSEDDGNYDYREINDVTISGIEESYTRLNGAEKLEINPVITTAFNDDSKLTYEWRLQRNNSAAENYRAVIGTERDLSWDVQVPYTGEWDVLFRVTDTETGVVTLANTVLNATTRTGSGIMLIGENTEGKSQVDFISIAGDTLVMTNMMNEGTGFSNSGKPVNICKAGKAMSLFVSMLPMWVMTDEDAWRFSTTFSITAGSSFRENTFVIDESQVSGHYYPVDFYPHYGKTTYGSGMSLNSVAICSNGLLFVGSSGFVDPINILSDEKGISFAKPYVLSGDGAGSFSSFVYYDETHERFLRGTTGSAYSTRLTDNEGDPFPWDNSTVGRTLKYAQNSTNTDGGSSYGNSFALMRDKNTGDYYIYKFYAYSTPVKVDCYKPGKVAANLDQAEHLVFSPKRTALYYTVGSQLWGLNYNKGNEKAELIQDFGDEITMMKRDNDIDNKDFIYLATYNPTTGGTLIKLSQGTNPDKLEVEEVPGSKWTGLSKVKSMAWK